MKYLVTHGLNKNKFDSLADAKQFVTQLDSEFILTNDDNDNRNGYRCRYLWGGYPEGIQVFILEVPE
jgi:hypothetical protein